MIKFKVITEGASFITSRYSLTQAQTYDIDINHTMGNMYKSKDQFLLDDIIKTDKVDFMVIGRIHSKDDLTIYLACLDYDKLRSIYGEIPIEEK